MSSGRTDLGLGYSYVRYVADTPAGKEWAGIILSCPHDADGELGGGSVPFDNAPVSGERPRWTVVHREPLTLSPSVAIPCGCHGWIREGRWVPA